MFSKLNWHTKMMDVGVCGLTYCPAVPHGATQGRGIAGVQDARAVRSLLALSAMCRRRGRAPLGAVTAPADGYAVLTALARPGGVRGSVGWTGAAGWGRGGPPEVTRAECLGKGGLEQYGREAVWLLEPISSVGHWRAGS
jgi:hypothetical protein